MYAAAVEPGVGYVERAHRLGLALQYFTNAGRDARERDDRPVLVACAKAYKSLNAIRQANADAAKATADVTKFLGL